MNWAREVHFGIRAEALRYGLVMLHGLLSFGTIRSDEQTLTAPLAWYKMRFYPSISATLHR